MKHQSLNDWADAQLPGNASDKAISDYLHWLEFTRKRSRHTVRAYASMLHEYARAVPDVRKATLTDMEEFCARPRVGRGAGGNGTAASRQRDAGILRAFYDWACARGVCPNLALDLKLEGVPKTNPKPVPDSQWSLLWQHPHSDDMRVMLGLGYLLGLRREEMVRLEPEMVDEVRITGFTRKGGDDGNIEWHTVCRILNAKLTHVLPSTETFSVPLMRLKAARTASGARYLLPWGNSPDAINRRLEGACAASGAKRHTPHQLRHSAATNLSRCGMPVELIAKVMNHTNVETTRRYVDASGSRLAEWAGF